MSILTLSSRLAARRPGGWTATLIGAMGFTVIYVVDRAAILRAPGGAAGRPSPGAVDVLIVLAFSIVAFGPVVLRGRGVTSNRRFDLLALSPVRRAIVRFATDSSAALVLGAVALALCLWSVAQLPTASGWIVGIRVLQVVAAAVVAVLLSDVLATHGGSRYPNVVYWSSLLIALIAVQYFLELPVLLRTPGEQAVIAAASGPSTDGSSAMLGALRLTGMLVVVAGLLLWIEIGVAATPVTRGAARTQSSSLARFLPARDALAVKERAYVLRPVISRNAALVSLLVVVGAFVVGQPLLHVVAFGFWIMFSQNAFAFDLPSAGVTRYALLPMAVNRIVHRRERTMWLIVATPVVVLALPALLFVRFDRWLLLWPFLAFGSGVFFLCALAGRFTSSRAPHAVARSAVLVQGSFIAIRGYFVIAAVIAATIVTALMVSAALRMWIASGTVATGAAFGFVGLAACAAYLAVCRRERHQNRLLFAFSAECSERG